MLPVINAEQVSRAADALLSADGIVITAGAGMGVDSGLPDFRGSEGFWRAYPVLKESGISFEDMADPQSFVIDPRRGWGFYGHRLGLYRATNPHPGFQILRQWNARCPEGAFVVTSNVDGQFQKAGFGENEVSEIHGSIHHLQCSKPCSESIWSADKIIPDVDEATLMYKAALPTCPRCGAIARPNILMFSDFGWVKRRATIQRLQFEEWLETIDRVAMIELGAGTAIPSIREMGRNIVQRKRGTMIRINVRESDVERRQDVGLACGALAGLIAIDHAISEIQ